MEFIFQCPHCTRDLTGESGSIGLEVVCPLCDGRFNVPAAPALEADETATPIETPQGGPASEAKPEAMGAAARAMAIVSAVATSAGATAKLLWLNIQLLFARGFHRSKALVRLGEKCHEERWLAAEESGLYEELEAQTVKAADLKAALAADAGAAGGWWEKVKQAGARWSRRAELAKIAAVRMKLHRDLGELFFQSPASAQAGDPAMARVVAEQQRIRDLEARAEQLEPQVPKMLAHPAIAGAVALALVAVAGLVMPQGAANALLPVAWPFGTPSVESDAQKDVHRASSGLRRGPKIHGFQLGMTLDEFRANLRRVYPEKVNEETYQDAAQVLGLPSIGDPVFDKLLASDAEPFSVSYHAEKSAFPLVNLQVIGEEQSVISMHLDAAILGRIFNLKNLTFREFCQELINSYGIPKLEPVPDRIMPSASNLAYVSRREGYSIVCSPTFTIELGIVPVDTKDRGFGR